MATSNISSRSLALKILGEVLSNKKFASDALDEQLKKADLSAKDRGLLTQLVYGVLREKGFLDHLLGEYIDLIKTQPSIQNLLCLGAYQVLFLDKIPDHAAIFESVEIAKKKSGESLGKLVNAVLRRIQTNREDFLKQRKEILQPLTEGKALTFKNISTIAWALSFPRWMVERWLKRYSPQQVLELANYFNGVPPIYLRANLCKTNPNTLAERFREDEVDVAVIEDAPILKINKFPENSLIPLFEEGLITLQDLSSYQVTQAVQAKPDEVGLDACSGHGGKSSAIAEQMGVGSQDFIPLYVHDISSTHLADLEQNFRRLGLWSPKILENSQQAKDDGLSFDWILVDAPCSGMGTLGRKPEIRWRMKENFFKRYQENQLKILSEWVPFLKPQGRLIYAVCSLEPEEGRDVVNGLLRDYPDLCEDFSKQNLPFESPQDGFFVSKIVKK